MKNFAYVDASSVADAVKSLGKNSLALAGGTDIINLMKDHIVEPEALVNLKSIPGLDTIQALPSGGLRIGANVRVTDILDHDGINKSYPALVEALWDVATPQVRNMSTLGGNLCGRPKCWYYRNETFDCAKRGGKGCPAIEGDNEFHAIFATGEPCVSIHPSSAAPALIVYGADFQISGPDGERSVAAEDFFSIPSVDVSRENVLADNEILTGVVLRANTALSATYEVRHKESHDWPLALASVALKLENGRVSEARICLGAVAPIPWRVPRAESVLRGQAINESAASRAASVAVEEARPLSENRFKVQLARTAIRRAIIQAATGRRV